MARKEDEPAPEEGALELEDDELLEETVEEDWDDESYEFKEPVKRPPSPHDPKRLKELDYYERTWRVEQVDENRHYLLEGRKKPKGTKKFTWNRAPTKLTIREVDCEPNPELGLKGGPARLYFGDVVELTPHLIYKHQSYIRDGSLGPRLDKPVRRSMKTSAKIVDRPA